MKFAIFFIVLSVFSGCLVQSIPLDDIEIGSDVSMEKIKEDIVKLLELLDIEIPKDFKIPPSVREWNDVVEGFKVV